MKKLIICILIISSFILSGCENKKEVENVTTNESISNNDSYIIEEPKKEIVEVDKNEEKEKTTTNKTTTTSTNKERNKTTEKKETTQKSFETQTKTKPVEKVETTKPTEEKKTETPKENIWDKLGMTEDQYYNQPMYKWEHVDFSVSKYGSESAAKNSCLKYGDTYQPYLNGEVAYNCSTVTSASGKYLGEMFYTEKLQ